MYGFWVLIFKWTQLKDVKGQINLFSIPVEKSLTKFNAHMIFMADTNVLFFGIISSVALGVAVWIQRPYFMLPYLYHEATLLLSYSLSVVEALVYQDYDAFGVLLIILRVYSFLFCID